MKFFTKFFFILVFALSTVAGCSSAGLPLDMRDWPDKPSKKIPTKQPKNFHGWMMNA